MLYGQHVLDLPGLPSTVRCSTKARIDSQMSVFYANCALDILSDCLSNTNIRPMENIALTLSSHLDPGTDTVEHPCTAAQAHDSDGHLLGDNYSNGALCNSSNGGQL